MSIPNLASLATQALPPDFVPITNMKTNDSSAFLRRLFANIAFITSSNCTRPLDEKAEEMKEHAFVIANIYKLRTKSVPLEAFPSLLNALVTCCRFYRCERLNDAPVETLAVASNLLMLACTTFFQSHVTTRKEASKAISAIANRLKNLKRTCYDVEACLSLVSSVCEKQTRMHELVYKHMHPFIFSAITFVAGPGKPVERLNFSRKTALTYLMRIFAMICTDESAVELQTWTKLETVFDTTAKVLHSLQQLDSATVHDRNLAAALLGAVFSITKLSNTRIPAEQRARFFNQLFSVVINFLSKNVLSSEMMPLFGICFKIFSLDLDYRSTASICTTMRRFIVVGILPVLFNEGLDSDNGVMVCDLIVACCKRFDGLAAALAEHVANVFEKNIEVQASFAHIVFYLKFVDFLRTNFADDEQTISRVSKFSNSPEFFSVFDSKNEEITAAAMHLLRFELHKRCPSSKLVNAVLLAKHIAGDKAKSSRLEFIGDLYKHAVYWPAVHAYLDEITKNVCSFIETMSEEDDPSGLAVTLGGISMLSEFKHDLVKQLPLILTTLTTFLQRVKLADAEDDEPQFTSEMIDVFWPMCDVIKNVLVFVCDDGVQDFPHLEVLGNFLMEVAVHGIGNEIHTPFEILNSFFLLDVRKPYMSLQLEVLSEFLVTSDCKRVSLLFPSFVLYTEREENLDNKSECVALFLNLICSAIERTAESNDDTPVTYSGYYELSWLLDHGICASSALDNCVKAFMLINMKNREIAKLNMHLKGFAPGQCVVLASLARSKHSHLFRELVGNSALLFIDTWLKSAPLLLNSRALVESTLEAIVALMRIYGNNRVISKMLEFNGTALFNRLQNVSIETFPNDEIIFNDDNDDDSDETADLPCMVIKDDGLSDYHEFDDPLEHECEHKFFIFWQNRQEERDDFQGSKKFRQAFSK